MRLNGVLPQLNTKVADVSPSIALHHHCQASVHELLSGAQDVVDSADVLAIGAWFGALSTPTPGITLT